MQENFCQMRLKNTRTPLDCHSHCSIISYWKKDELCMWPLRAHYARVTCVKNTVLHVSLRLWFFFPLISSYQAFTLLTKYKVKVIGMRHVAQTCMTVHSSPLCFGVHFYHFFIVFPLSHHGNVIPFWKAVFQIKFKKKKNKASLELRTLSP